MAIVSPDFGKSCFLRRHQVDGVSGAQVNLGRQIGNQRLCAVQQAIRHRKEVPHGISYVFQEKIPASRSLLFAEGILPNLPPENAGKFQNAPCGGV